MVVDGPAAADGDEADNPAMAARRTAHVPSNACSCATISGTKSQISTIYTSQLALPPAAPPPPCPPASRVRRSRGGGRDPSLACVVKLVEVQFTAGADVEANILHVVRPRRLLR
jgi:hypothetical protein